MKNTRTSRISLDKFKILQGLLKLKPESRALKPWKSRRFSIAQKMDGSSGFLGTFADYGVTEEDVSNFTFYL
jgi:hypothetical protein